MAKPHSTPGRSAIRLASADGVTQQPFTETDAPVAPRTMELGAELRRAREAKEARQKEQERQAAMAAQDNCKILSIASGKGGVGKTVSTIQLAIALQKQGKRVLILDGDLGLANIDVVLGIRGRYNIRDVIDRKVTMKDIILHGPFGIKVIPSGSGLFDLGNLSYLQRIYLLNQLDDLKPMFDILLVDSGAGISETTLHLNSISRHKIIVTTTEPHAMTDAYAFIKVLTEQYGTDIDVHLVVNMAHTPTEGLKIHRKIADVAKNFLNLDVKLLGCIPNDPQLSKIMKGIGTIGENGLHTLSFQSWKNLMDEFLTYVDTYSPPSTCALIPEGESEFSPFFIHPVAD